MLRLDEKKKNSIEKVVCRENSGLEMLQNLIFSGEL